MTIQSENVGLEAKAMVITISAPRWEALKIDRRVSDEAQDQNKAKRDSGYYKKHLMSKEDLYPLNHTVTELWDYIGKHCLPWGAKGSGSYLLSAEAYFEVLGKLAELERQYWEAKDELIAKFTEKRDRQIKALGNMGNIKDYPSISELESRLRFDVTIDPISTGGQLHALIGLNKIEIERLEKEVEARQQMRIDAAVKTVWAKIKEVVTHLHERLSDPDAKFHDTLITNIKELVGVIPQLNITGDKQLSEAAERLEKELGSIEPQTLRDNKRARKQVVKSAEQIIADMAPFFDVNGKGGEEDGK